MLRAISFVSIGSLVGSLLTLISGVILARSLEPEGMGQIQLIFTLVTMVATLATFGVGRANIYILNKLKAPIDAVVTNTLVYAFLLSPVVIFVVILFLNYGQEQLGTLGSETGIFITCASLFMLVHALCRPIFIAQMHVSTYAVLQPLIQVIMLLMLLALLMDGSLTLTSAIFSFAMAQLVGVFFVLFNILPYISLSEATIQGIIRSIKIGVPLHATNVFLFLDQQLGIIMVSFLMPGCFDELGYLSRAIAIVGMFRVLLGGVFDVLYSKWSTSKCQNRIAHVEFTSRVMFMAGLIITGLIIAMSDWIVLILYGEAYLPSVALVKIFAFQQFFWLQSKVLQSFFSSIGKAKLSMMGVSISLFVNFATMVLLIPLLGVIGAAIAATISQLLYWVICLSLARGEGLGYYQAILLNKEDMNLMVSSIRYMSKRK